MAWSGWEDYRPPLTPVTPAQAKAAKRNKFNAQPHWVEKGGRPVLAIGPTPARAQLFPSRREAERYVLLAQEMASGGITALQLQPQFPLHVVRPDGVKVCIGRYIADFAYERDGQKVIEDSKGMKTPIYLWKRAHVQAEYGLTVVEV